MKQAVGIIAIVIGGVITPGAASAQKCVVICSPSVSFTIDTNRSHLFNAPSVRSLKDNSVHKLPSKTNTQLQLIVDMPTKWKPVHLFATAQWLPTAEAKSNPFTQYTASETDESSIKANLPSLTAGAQFYLLQSEATNGWLGGAVYGADLFSKAQQPDDESDYTHKLDIGAFALIGIFNWTAQHAWIHNVKAAVTLDYVATGLPHAGDEVPAHERVFLGSVHSPTLIVGAVIPVAPLKAK